MRCKPPLMYKYALNLNAFDELTSECLYWLGFLAADGYVKTDKDRTNRIKLELQGGDIDHLQKFANFIGTNKKIDFYERSTNGIMHPVARIEVFGQHLVDKIRSYGIKSPKSEIKLENQTIIYSPDFWRGYIDGNGTWSKNSNNNNETINLRLVITSPNLNILNNFLLFAKSIVGDFRAGISRMEYTAKIVQVYGWRVRKLAELMYYDGSIYLDRKLKKIIGLTNADETRNYLAFSQ